MDAKHGEKLKTVTCIRKESRTPPLVGPPQTVFQSLSLCTDSSVAPSAWVKFGEGDSPVSDKDVLNVGMDCLKKIAHSSLVTVRLEESDDSTMWGQRVVQSYSILPSGTKVFGAFYATVDEFDRVHLWTPSKSVVKPYSFLFSTRPEHSIIDDVVNTGRVAFVCSAVFAAAAVASHAFSKYSQKRNR